MIPASYTKCEWRCVQPQQENGDIAFAFNTEAGPIRLYMSEYDVLGLIGTFVDMMSQRRGKKLSQSDSSSGSPSSEGSPQAGQSV